MPSPGCCALPPSIPHPEKDGVCFRTTCERGSRPRKLGSQRAGAKAARSPAWLRCPAFAAQSGFVNDLVHRTSVRDSARNAALALRQRPVSVVKGHSLRP